MRCVVWGIEDENARLVCCGDPSCENVELGPTVVSVIVHFLDSEKGPGVYTELLDLRAVMFVEPRPYLGL